MREVRIVQGPGPPAPRRAWGPQEARGGDSPPARGHRSTARLRLGRRPGDAGACSVSCGVRCTSARGCSFTSMPPRCRRSTARRARSPTTPVAPSCACGSRSAFRSLFAVAIGYIAAKNRTRKVIHPAGSRRPAIGAGAGLPVGDRDRPSWPSSRAACSASSAPHLRHLHGAGLEHDVRLLPLDGDDPERHAGSSLDLRAYTLATLSRRSSCPRRRTA